MPTTRDHVLAAGLTLAVAGYVAWSWFTERQLVGFFIEHQARDDGTYGVVFTLLATVFTVVGVVLLVSAMGYGLRSAVRRERLPPELVQTVTRFRLPRAIVGGLAFAFSGAVTAGFVFAPDAVHETLGGLTQFALLLVAVCPISLALTLEFLVPPRYADGEVNDLRVETRPGNPPVTVHIAHVGHRQAVVPLAVYRGLVEGERAGLVTSGGVLQLFIMITRPRSDVGPYR